MKTRTWLNVVLLLLFLGGCIEKESFFLPDEADGSIQFMPYERKEATFTKGTPIETALNLSEFIVFGYYTGTGTANNWSEKGSDSGPNFLSNQSVTNEGYGTSVGKWTYYPSVYWPQDEEANLSFFAYTPAVSSINGLSLTDTIGGLKLQYTAPENCADQPDLMMAVPQTDLNETHTGAVNLEMRHALTCIGFSAVGSADIIETIEVTNVIVSGEVSFDIKDTVFVWTLDDPVSTTYNAIPNDSTINNNYQSIVAANGYLMLPPQTLQSGALLTITAKYSGTKTFDLSGQEWQAGQFINYKFDVTLTVDDITNTPITNGFIGAFWRYNETTERIIRMSNTGSWEAFLLCTDDQWNDSDIMMDVLPSGYSATQGTSISSSIQQITTNQSVIKGNDDISFRIGLTTETVLATDTTKPRYAIVAVRYDNYEKYHFIYLRQGEAGDSINGSAQFSPYNLSTNGTSANNGTYSFVTYPSMGGGLQQWSSEGVLYPVSGSGMSSNVTTDTIANACPQNYRIPTDSDYFSLLNTSGSGTSSSVSISGMYADGYFDRAAISDLSAPVVGSGDSIAYGGNLIYNNDTYASLFFPCAGRRVNNSIADNKSTGYYLTTTLGAYGSDTYKPYYLNVFYQGMSDVTIWCDRTDACSIRPVLTVNIDSPDTINGELDGFTDNNGWEN